MEQEKSVALEEYIPGVANGHHYMAKLCRFAEGPWTIEVIHVEGLPPLSPGDGSWPTREEALQAADKLVAALAH